MIDCGHNVASGWQPGDHLRSRGITELDILIVTNYDEDHVSGLPNLLRKVHVKTLFRNKGVTPKEICALKSEDGMGSGIDALVDLADAYTSPVDFPPIPGVEFSSFRLTYPEFEDENNLSYVVHLLLEGNGFLFPGDMERAGWKTLLTRESGLRTAAARTDVLIASHHGREGGICDELFDVYACNPYWVVISDKGYQHETQETVNFYASKAKGATSGDVSGAF